MSVLSGITIVFTGTMSKVRPDMEFEVHDLGAIPEERVTRRTDWLVTGKRPGERKLDKAKEWGKRIITEDELRTEIARRRAQDQGVNAEEEATEAGEEDVEPVVRETPAWLKELKGKAAIQF